MNEHTSLSYKQPRGLYLLFFTELWERFGFYTIQTILILYLTKSLLYTDVNANFLYSAFSALLYITPVIGGYLADHYFGFQRAIIIGGTLLLVGYICTALPGTYSFFIGLSILACANGLFKPSVSSIVGDLYEPGDPRRDGGFTLFYMGINLGSLIPPLLTGALVAYVGWHAGFGLAAVGMAIGLTTFVAGKKVLQHRGQIPAGSPLLTGGAPRLIFYTFFWVGLIAAVGLCLIALHFSQVTNYLTIIAAVLIMCAVFFLGAKESKAARKKIIAAIMLIIISIIFWAFYNQTFTSLTLFADRNMVQHLWKIPLNAEAMQFFNPFFIVLLSPILSVLWIYLDRNKINPSYPSKFAFGVLFVSLGFLLLAFGVKYFTHQGLTSPWWLIWSYFLQTIGELLLSPIGLSMITVLVPKRLVGMMMGVWFFAQAAAFAIGGHFANLAAVPDQARGLASLPIYGHAFNILGWLSLAFAILCFILIPFLKRLISDSR